MITPFALPSNPNVQIQLREATVADAIDFADVDGSHEEELTTMFLNRMQDGGTVRNSRTWTAADRRFALYWYWLHTSNDIDIALSYDCKHCGQKHVYLQDFRELAEQYTPINGEAKREAGWKGEVIIVHPLSGADMETLERMRIGLEAASADPAEFKIRQTLMTFEHLMLSFSFKAILKDEEKRKKITGMTLPEFSEFTDFIYGLLAEMKHGLEMEYSKGRLYLVMPAHKCPEKEGQTQLRYPFRNIDYIPKL